ncbi:hypothetical protein EJB05_05275, partial [Eragrostis curvula]
MSSKPRTALVFCLLTTTLAVAAFAVQTEPVGTLPASAEQQGACAGPAVDGKCHSVAKALRLKLIAIPTILVASMAGVCLPLFSRSVPALRPDGGLFVVVKAFASGVILGTGYMHVLPDSFRDLTSSCLPERLWAQFPFVAFVAMLAALFTLIIDSLMLSFHSRRNGAAVAHHGHGDHSPMPRQGHCHGYPTVQASSLRRQGRTVMQTRPLWLQTRRLAKSGSSCSGIVLELGIVVHSVVIGLGMGASQNVCTIRPLVAALCFHQLTGPGRRPCWSSSSPPPRRPFGVALGLALTNVYSDTSPTALVVVGLLNAASAGLLHYMALVDLLAADFMGPRMQASVRLQLVSFLAVLLGAGGMSVMAKWA